MLSLVYYACFFAMLRFLTYIWPHPCARIGTTKSCVRLARAEIEALPRMSQQREKYPSWFSEKGDAPDKCR